MKKELWLSDAVEQYNKKFDKDVLNILNSHAGSGKTSYIFNNFLKNTHRYVKGMRANTSYNLNLDKVMYICDTNMLKQSILQDKGLEGKVKILAKGEIKKACKSGSSLKEYLKNGHCGKVLVITYSTLGLLLENEVCRDIILNHYNCIIMDEIHKLFTYANRYGGEYETIINNIPGMLRAKDLLTIGVTATPENIYYRLEVCCIRYTNLFNNAELSNIKKYTDGLIRETNCIMNDLKLLALRKKALKNKKIFIYSDTKKMMEKYKVFLESNGFNAEWLCSINNKIENDNGEMEVAMNENQLKIREGLLDNGLLPDNLDVLIVNSAYDTGWNLRDKRVKIAIIDSTDSVIQVQARNRVRDNITELIKKVKCTDKGEIIELNRYKQELYTNRFVHYINLTTYLDDKFIGVKLSNNDKQKIIDTYASKGYSNNKVSWKTVKNELEEAGYIVKSDKKGTYIFKTNEEIKKDSKKELKKGLKDMSNKDLYSYLDTLVGKKLYKAEQKELAINANIKRNGKLLKGSDAINAGLKEDNIPYVIAKVETDWERTLLDGSKNPMYGKVYWIVAEV
mgnify:FL=1